MASWFVPAPRLDSEQLGILSGYKTNSNGNLWVSGYAGSGKSVILIHLLITEKELHPNASVIIVVYTHALIDLLRTGIPEKYKNTPVITYFDFQKHSTTYDLVLVDEIQDLPQDVIYSIKQRGKKVIVAGDTNQSIYEDTCSPKTTKSILNASEKRLMIIHRISRNIRTVASYFCSDSSGFNAAAMGKMVEMPPRLVRANSYDEEIRWLWKSVKDYAETGYSPVILLPNHKQIEKFLRSICTLVNKAFPLGSAHITSSNRKEQYDTINQSFSRNGIPLQYLGNGSGSFNSSLNNSLITVMTYHSAKGLDYKAVFIPFLSESLSMYFGNIPSSTLFFVALTRSREQLFLSYHSSKHELLNRIPSNYFHNLNASELLKNESGIQDSKIHDADDIF